MISNRTNIGFGLLLVLCLFSIAPAWAGGKGPAWDALPAAAMTDTGLARVIVGLTVADYDALAARSAQYKVVTPDEAPKNRAASKAADAALEAAIASSVNAVLASLPKSAYTVYRTYSALPFVAVAVNAKALEALQAEPGVTSIEVDAPIPLPLPVPSGSGAKGESGAASTAPPQLPTSGNLNWGPPKIGADTAWSRGYTGAGWTVAILDTGIRRTHEFFAGKTIVEACFSANSNCPGGTKTAYGPGSAVHYANTYTGYDHGTHCAGIATGNKADGTVAGVAKNANLIAVQVFSIIPDTTPWIGSYPSDQLAGLNYVYSLRGSTSIAAASMSLGGGAYSTPCDSASQKAGVDLLRSVNIATTIATGNDGYCSYISSPACISTAIAVGASTSGDGESYFNNWNPNLQTLFAPGSGIYSSTGASDTSYASWDGTSMATPHVAGTWAILRQNRPNDSVGTILSRVLAGGTPIVTGCGTGLSKPRVYIPAALEANASSTQLLPLLLDQ
ncbi:serine alkaline protease (subtilisin E) [Desulfovibrio sp. DV]|uniref:S8 family serine peptidase n=1 Tax=Desulfovibrio sp. DV TaxID=1844708 RepID=UPI00094B8599|nr:S8 family serine peptidase [Desulfovibrio sp. DV]OLN27302.1 serine alkaline protease (subtilisin E) [Desulfovibrio sp. DV]